MGLPECQRAGLADPQRRRSAGAIHLGVGTSYGKMRGMLAYQGAVHAYP